jgi:hypothetical protein
MTATSMDQTPLARRRHRRLQRHRPELARVVAANGFDPTVAAEDPHIEEVLPAVGRPLCDVSRPATARPQDRSSVKASSAEQ